MKQQLLQEALELTLNTVTEAGDNLRPHLGRVEAEAKVGGNGAFDVVTELDIQTELFLQDRLTGFDPSFGFRGEEHGVQAEGDTTWLVDPIDGTQHFVRGTDMCTVMVALIEDGEVVLSAIHNIATKQNFYATRSGGAFVNGTRIHISERPLKGSMMVFESKLRTEEDQQLQRKFSALSTTFATVNCGYEFSMIASGKFDGKIGKDPYGCDWDMAPGSLLVQEAGGVVANIGDTGYDYQNHDYIATNRPIFEELTSGPDSLFPLRQSE